MDQNLSSGRSQLNSQLVASAAQLAAPAAQLASGASKIDVATGLLKDAALDKLLGPAAAFSGLLVGSLVTIRKIVRETQIIEKGLQSIGKRQNFEGPFETLLKSATLAKQRIKELYEFTAKSPFRFADVAQANLNLLKLTRGAWAGKEAMQVIGDAAAATGNSMSDLSHVVGRLMNAIAQGKPIDRLLFQFQGTGVITDDLAEKLTHLRNTGASVTEQFAAVTAALALTAGGMKNAKSMQDLTNKMDEAIETMQRAFGEPFLEAKEKSIVSTTKAAQALTPVLAQVGADLATVGTLWTDFKSGLKETAAATPGATSVLLGLWGALKTGIVVLTAVSVAAGVAGATSMFRFAAGAANAALGATKAGAAAAALASAKAKLSAATAAATRLELLNTAANGASMVGLYAKAAALAVHEAATKAAAGATGFLAARNYVLAASSVVAAGALKLAAVAIRFVALQIKAATLALFANPFTAFVAGAALVATFLHGLNKRLAETARLAKQASDQMAAFRTELSRRYDGIDSLEQWGAHLEYLRQQYRELSADVRQYNRDVAAGAEKSEEEAHDQRVRVSNREQIRKELARTLTKDSSKFGVSERQREALIQEEAERRAAVDDDYRRKLAAETNPERRVQMQRERAESLRAQAAEAATAREAAKQFAMSPAGRELERLKNAGELSEQNYADRRAAIEDAKVDAGRRGASPKKLAEFEAKKAADLAALDAEKAAADAVREEKRRQVNLGATDPRVRARQELEDARKSGADSAVLDAKERAFANANALVDSAPTLARDAADAETEAKVAARDHQRSTEDLRADAYYTAQIAEAVKSGNTARAESLRFDQEQASLSRRIARAREDEDAALESLLEAQRSLAREERGRAREQFAQERAVDRAVNAATIRGDQKRAQALRDAADLRKLQREYGEQGLTMDQARRDFEQTILAQAAGRAPSIVADSRQTIGGGGGSYQGRDPLLRAQDRIARLNEQMVAALRSIDSKIDD